MVANLRCTFVDKNRVVGHGNAVSLLGFWFLGVFFVSFCLFGWLVCFCFGVFFLFILNGCDVRAIV